jgi:glycosyltransferase involved in cell wall biosynthesis
VHNHGGIAAIVWAPSLRHAEDHSKCLDASFYRIHYLLHKRPILAPIKYIPQCLKTWMVLFRQRPSAVYVFISPVFAALSVCVYCKIAAVPFIMDVGGQALISRKWKWTIPLVRLLAKQARVNIVDQQRFKLLFESWGAETLLLERPPLVQKWQQNDSMIEEDQFTVTLVNTFSGDEPIELVLAAAERLPDVRFFILGDTALAKRSLLAKAPGNVIFTGYLSGDDYWELLDASRAVMVFTTDHHSLTSGAVEGMALGKPLILSNQPALTDYFTKGVVFVDHSAERIVKGVQTVQDQEHHLTQQIHELAIEKRERWEREFQKIWGLLGVEN